MAELYTKLFISAAVQHSQLITTVASLTGGVVQRFTVATRDSVEFDVLPNALLKEAAGSGQTPDDFLGWPFTVEVVAEESDVQLKVYLERVAHVMTGLHRAGMSVVAANDWESDLPGGGRLVR